ncbi:MIX and LysM peptidoglycan-binding domain-containing protein [Aliivibrio salmonicida]|uniref:MIX and LysM peptidoglycan-binding domain-containing protein n=1 Tax=Aliivibrio salmonicida TaxID=40269 RepID=UPI00406C0B5E
MKVWDEKLGQHIDTVDGSTQKFVNAYYPWNEDLAREAKADVPHHEPIKEKQAQIAAFEYSIEIACAQDELNTYQVGVFSLGKTKEETNISTWNKTQTDKGFTLLTASVNVDEPKALNREFFISSGSAMVFNDVKPVKQGVTNATESFIPVKPAVQVEERLGWPTEGYFYHFIDDALVHEYKLMGNGKWAFQVTLSTMNHLTDELLSAHQYGFILLPWKINNLVVARQHLLYLPQKMTTQQLEALTSVWLDDNGCLLDVNEIVETRKEKAVEREKENNGQVTYVIQSGDTLSGIAYKQGLTLSQLVGLNPQYKGQEDRINIGDSLVLEEAEADIISSEHIVKINPETSMRETWGEIAIQYGLAAKALLNLNPMYEQDPTSLKVGDTLFVGDKEKANDIKQTRKTLPPIDVTKEKTVFSWANLWSEPQSPTIHPVVATLHKLDSIPKNTTVINVRAKKHGINPKNMYWPAYDFTKEGDDRYLNVEYTQNIVKFAVLEPKEWTVFFDSFDKVKTLKDGVTGLYDARETAKALGGLGVTVFVKTVDDIDYVILKNYDKWSQTLLYGGVFKANSSQIVKLGLGGLVVVK